LSFCPKQEVILAEKVTADALIIKIHWRSLFRNYRDYEKSAFIQEFEVGFRTWFW
jgi:hypothetical protein